MFIEISKFQKGLITHLLTVRSKPVPTELLLAIMGWKVPKKLKKELPMEINPAHSSALEDLAKIFPKALAKQMLTQ